jgi:hypothetical protein
MICISKQHLKKALSNEVSKSENPFTGILYKDSDTEDNQV